MTAIARNFLKFNTSVLLAALITFLLFYFMQYLIATESESPPAFNVIPLVDSTVPVFDNFVVIEEERPEPIVAEDIPIVSEPSRADNVFDGPVIRISTETIEIEASPEDILPMSNNIMIPLIRTTPNYPSRALQRGIEGFVELSFTVDRFGSVVDPVVINAVPEGIFDRSALQAISRWKYSPAMNNGQPVETYDVRHRIVFEMEADSR
ncbi:MAG: protein TonB [Pseudohongiella sp.]|nr:MAG: protein TonB [Pseudohongiella sp.]